MNEILQNNREDFIEASSKKMRGCVEQLSSSMVKVITTHMFFQMNVDLLLRCCQHDERFKKCKRLQKQFHQQRHGNQRMTDGIRRSALEEVAYCVDYKYDSGSYKEASARRNTFAHIMPVAVISVQGFITFNFKQEDGKIIDIEKTKKEFFEFNKKAEKDLSSFWAKLFPDNSEEF